uniref:Low molecular weight phosphotyrosine protein phosphatase n=1 Tax=Lutzomyia longipalpis TaxID=7200 RepID=A0A1B0CHS7_LUTLO
MCATTERKLRILFVCIGNSCRSPMAEAVMKNLLPGASTWEMDSAAIASWNVGLPPEERCLRILQEHGLDSNHIARQVTKADFYRFDFIFGMDPRNVEDLQRIAPADATAKIELLGRYDSERDNVILDPYFETGDHGFRRCFEQISRSCVGFLRIHGATRLCHAAAAAD